MKNLRFIFPIFLLGLFLAGCSYDEGPLPGDAEPLAEKESALKGAKKKHAVPFKNTFECWGEFISMDGPIVHQAVYGSGKATHLGKSELLITDEAIDMSGSPWTTKDVKVVLTAANGDELNLFYSSSIDPSPLAEPSGAIIVEGAEGYIFGGKGRFENATGTITYEGVWPFHTEIIDGEPVQIFEIGTCTFNGTIQY